jgi:hypothetical protein
MATKRVNGSMVIYLFFYFEIKLILNSLETNIQDAYLQNRLLESCSRSKATRQTREQEAVQAKIAVK